MSNGRLVVDVGSPSPEFQGWSTCEVRYHSFALLPSAKAKGTPDYTTSPAFHCLGRQWDLTVYPGGHPDSGDGMISIYLLNRSDRGIRIRYCLGVVGPGGSDVVCLSSAQSFFGPKGFPGHGSANFAHRSGIVDSLMEGALVIEVRMRLADSTEAATFVPENPFANVMLGMLDDEGSADVVFEVCSEQKGTGGNERKKSRTAPVTFRAHRLVLESCASTLAELCGPGGGGGRPVPVVPIADVRPHIFGHLLRYIYGGCVPRDDLRYHAREIIDAADKYGVTTLKLEAEACLVNSTPITVDNMMEHLLYADSKNCALLKEAVMDFIVDNEVYVLEHVSLRDLPGGPTLFADVLAAMARGKRKGQGGGGGSDVGARGDSGGGLADGSGGDQFSTMRISDLRRKVHGRGLDIDGSRETLIASLQESS